jgi:hypothetical protein
MHIGLPVAVEVAADGMQHPGRSRVGFLGIRLPRGLALVEDDGAFLGGGIVLRALHARDDRLEILELLRILRFQVLRLEPGLGVLRRGRAR